MCAIGSACRRGGQATQQNRTIPQRHVDRFDQAALDAQASEGPRVWSEDELARIEYARRIWNEAKDPRETLAAKYLCELRRLELPEDLAVPRRAFIRVALGAMKTPARPIGCRR